MRFFRKPAPLIVQFPQGKAECDFDVTFRALIEAPELTHSWDRKTRKAVRKAVLGHSVGELITMEDVHWEQLLPHVRHPKTILPALLDADADAGDAHLGALENATTVRPREPAE